MSVGTAKFLSAILKHKQSDDGDDRTNIWPAEIFAGREQPT